MQMYCTYRMSIVDSGIVMHTPAHRKHAAVGTGIVHCRITGYSILGSPHELHIPKTGQIQL